MKLNKTRLVIPLLIFLFVWPMVGAWLCYVESPALHFTTMNSGQLIDTPLDFSRLKLTDMDGTRWNPTIFKHHWILFYLIPASSAANCEKNLYSMRQVRIALGKDRDRLERLVITFPNNATPSLDKLINNSYEGTQHVAADTAQIKNFFGADIEASIALRQGTLYLVDPLGNVMMKYTSDIAPKKLLSDLTRLLKVSQIG